MTADRSVVEHRCGSRPCGVRRAPEWRNTYIPIYTQRYSRLFMSWQQRHLKNSTSIHECRVVHCGTAWTLVNSDGLLSNSPKQVGIRVHGQMAAATCGFPRIITHYRLYDNNEAFSLVKCIQRLCKMCRMDRWLFWSWFDGNRSTFNSLINWLNLRVWDTKVKVVLMSNTSFYHFQADSCHYFSLVSESVIFPFLLSSTSPSPIDYLPSFRFIFSLSYVPPSFLFWRTTFSRGEDVGLITTASGRPLYSSVM